MPSNEIQIKHGGNSTTIVIDSLIAKGGMGEVFEGRIVGPNGFEKPVAIKRILDKFGKETWFRNQFFQEAKIGASLESHQNIIQTLAYGESDLGDLYLVMELFNHPTLKEAMIRTIDAGACFSDAVVLKIISQLSDALKFLHADDSHASIIHRDLSPSNILIDPSSRIKLIDLGVSLSKKGENEITSKTPGKLLYAAPELLAGSEANEKTDLYSLGVIAFELCNCFHPFEGADASNILERIKQGPTWAEGSIIDRDLKALVTSLLEFNPDKRPSSARDVLRTCDKLRKRIGEPVIEGTIADIQLQKPLKSPHFGLKQTIPFAIVAVALCAVIFLKFREEHSRVDSPSLFPEDKISITLQYGLKPIAIGPDAEAVQFYDYPRDPAKKLFPSACILACRSLWGPMSFLIGVNNNADPKKDNFSLDQFLKNIPKVMKEQVPEYLLNIDPVCGDFPLCQGVKKCLPWLPDLLVSETFQADLKNLKSLPKVTNYIFKHINQEQAQSTIFFNQKTVEMTLSQSEYKSISETLAPSLLGTHEIHGIDIVQIHGETKDVWISECEKLGDELFGKMIEPIQGTVPSGQIAEGRFLFLPSGANLKILEKSASKIGVRWENPSIESSIWKKGMCYYSRTGPDRRRVIQWIPRIPKNEMPSR
jgi:serine/threonine protein kinase